MCVCVCVCVRVCVCARACVCVCARERDIIFRWSGKGISADDSNILLLCATHRSSLSTLLLCFKCELGLSIAPSMIRPFVRSFVRGVVSVNVSLLVRTEITRGSVRRSLGF